MLIGITLHRRTATGTNVMTFFNARANRLWQEGNVLQDRDGFEWQVVHLTPPSMRQRQRDAQEFILL